MKTMKLATLAALCQMALVPVTHAAVNGDLSLGGFVRANYSLVDYSDSSKDKGGDASFDAMSITFDGKIDDIGISVDYRFASGFNYIKRGYGYYDFNDNTQLQLGIVKVPFGKEGFLSNSYWFSTNYYLGFEDNYDTGAKLVWNKDNWHLDFAFIKGAEYGSDTTERYGADIIGAHEEMNQVNARAVYTIPMNDGHLKLGASVEAGQLYFSEAGSEFDGKDDSRYAYAAHADLQLGAWNFQAQVTNYKYNTVDGADTLTVGVVGAAYDIAAEAYGYNFNVARAFDMGWGTITVYNDYGLVAPEGKGQDDSMQNVTGVSISRGPIYTYIDYIIGDNMTFAGGPGVGLDNDNTDNESRLNINFGFYF
ncbi:hypothetical protein [Ferrimonas aestuarii]|uniref:Porin n=1 Tax=Ferrimonas aestuarii TaxID=2569539 RepID=A0A4U1BNV2_9GAMM|nr:hypothetical protein [Ferrimonas aestuarii]TKB54965.1 hypothetical protein FCL42_10375 [Ferrimonas aestuarii]